MCSIKKKNFDSSSCATGGNIVLYIYQVVVNRIKMKPYNFMYYTSNIII